MEEGLMEYSWIVSEIEDTSLVFEFSDDITKDELMLYIGDYETADVNEHKFKVKTDLSPRKLEKFQENLCKIFHEKLFN